MNYIFFTFLYILGPEISTARKYLIIDLDALEQLEIIPQGARRQSDNIIKPNQQPKDFLKSVINTLQSYDEDQLNNAFNSFKTQLSNLNVDDANFNVAKEYVLNEFPGTQIKDLMNVMSQILDGDDYDDQINNAFNSFKKEITGLHLDDATLDKAKQDFLAQISQVKRKSSKPVRPSKRSRDNEQKVGRLLDHFTPRSSRAEPKINILDTLKSALRSVANFLFKPKEPTRSDGDDFTPEEKDALSKLANQLQNLKGNDDKTDWKTDMFSKLFSKLQNQGDGGDKSDWKKDMFGKLANKLQNPSEDGDQTDWKSLLSNFVQDAKGNDSVTWLMTILKKLASNDKAWEMLGKYAKDMKPSERGHGVHLSF